MGGRIYRDSAPPDVVNRAATQQQTQQMASQRMRSEALKSCYTERGYHEFKLTPEQRAPGVSEEGLQRVSPVSLRHRDSPGVTQEQRCRRSEAG